jgi:hypothetical protein
MFTRRRIAGWISKLQTLKGQFLPLVERTNPSKNELFGTMAHLETGLVEHSRTVHKSLEVEHHLRRLPLGVHRPNPHGTIFGETLSSNPERWPSGPHPGDCVAESIPSHKTVLAQSESRNRSTRTEKYMEKCLTNIHTTC